MSARYDKLKDLLKTLFQLNRPELDFGLYRIMHARSAEVTAFLDEDLLPQVEAAFGQYRSADRADIEKELSNVIAGVKAAGMDPEESPKVQQLRTRLEEDAVDVSTLEAEVYDHLYRFFRRYYSEGDFLSKRVYKPGVYAIPYEGEEVKLHWANADQYYTKTSEYLRDYAFRLRPGSDSEPLRVHFRLVDAAEGEHGNVKESKDRVFILAPAGETGHDFATIEEGDTGPELVIRFEYRPATMQDWPPDKREEEQERLKNPKPPKQSDLDDLAVARLLGLSDPDLAPWIAQLSKPHVLSSGEEADYTRLEAHLRRYNARNTFDYFIHQDLGGFLRRELDFYIKNEVMHLDDIEDESVPRVEQYLSKIWVIRQIAGKIIDFLAQLEDFQKKLWLKKKFVVETSWCIRLGILPEGLYAEIAANEAQREEWVALHAIDEMQENQGDLTRPRYSDPLTPEFLAANPTLMVDTRHFEQTFVGRLLEAVGDLDEQTDGVLFHSENFQALNLMQARYREQVQCIYIDPPYNTDASAIDYKNGYKASSWIALIEGRIALSRHLLSHAGVLVAAIDDEQQRELSFVLSGAFNDRLLGTICVRSNPSGRPTQSGYSVSHEYLLFAGRDNASGIGRMPPTEKQMSRFSQRDEIGPFEWRNLRREGSDSERRSRPAMYYPIYVKDGTIRIPQMSWDADAKEWIVEEAPKAGEQVVWPTNDEGVEKRWRWEHETVQASLEKLTVRKDRAGRDYVYYKRRPHEEGVVSVSSWFAAKYSATEHGTAVLKALFADPSFSYPKSIHAVVDAVYVAGASSPSSLTLDYFAGSGTTGHAVINLNREDGGRRRFVLVEVGEYFDTVLLPRLKKVTFTPEWKDGRPMRPATAEEAECSPRVMKVVRLESYEDTLNNLETRRTDAQQDLLDQTAAGGPDGFREDYLLRYMLDVETRGSQSLLNIQAFSDPTAYQLKVKRPGSDESREVAVDLIETFNWLIGLRVERLAAPRAYRASFERDAEGRLRLDGALEPDDEGPYWFRTVTGAFPDGRRALVIWRKRTGEPEEDNAVLDEWFREQGYSDGEDKFDLVYVHGGSTLQNLREPEETWRLRLIEEEFHRLMFEAEAG